MENLKLNIDEELKELLPPLTKEEYDKLENNILEKGYQKNMPIFIWNGYIADGHNRYSICQKHNIEFTHAVLDSTMTKVEVMRWMLDTQLGRRNLSPVQRIVVAKKYEDKFRELARENKSRLIAQSNSNRILNKPQLGDNEQVSLHTENEISKLANVGKGTISRFNVVANSDNEELKQKMFNDELTINAAYELTKKEKGEPTTKRKEGTIIPPVTEQEPSEKKCLKCKQIKPILDYRDNGDFCNECMNDIYAPMQNTTEITGDSEVEKIIKELKTPKLAADYIVVKSEILSIKNSIEEKIKLAEDRIFNRYDLPSKMNKLEKESLINYFEYLEKELCVLKNKVKNADLKGELK